ncbi:uncharacterized protein LOC111193619 [Astyanax mexicanus]|uniref:uncharacterized protein LOC111193619 n=1 Tax=Astyanax mexicanus TaxID=7994 RepID=UPI0020CB59A7|nr:uncharacterized protein LOC111193619 [Astyanax mexicanus]
MFFLLILYRVYTFVIFGNKIRTIQREEILNKIKDLQISDITLDASLSNVTDFWGKVCSELGIPNNKRNRYRLRRVHECHKHAAGLSPSTQQDKDDSRDKEDGQKSAENAPAMSPSPLKDTDDSWTKEDGQKSPENAPAMSPSPLKDKDDSWTKEDGQKSPEKSPVSSTSDEQGFLKIPVPQKPSYFFIDRKDWENIKKKRKQRGFKGLQWTNVISKGLQTIYPYCSIAFKRHKLKIIGSKKASPEFWCLGYCRFEDCPITVTVTVNSEKDLKADL